MSARRALVGILLATATLAIAAPATAGSAAVCEGPVGASDAEDSGCSTTGTEAHTLVSDCWGAANGPKDIEVGVDDRSVGATVPSYSVIVCVGEDYGNGYGECVRHQDDGHTVWITVGDDREEVSTPIVGVSACVFTWS